MIRFLHAADLHLDSPFASLTPAQAAIRRKEQLELLQSLTDAANAHECDLVLLSGDLFDADDAYPETVQALSRALAGMRAEVFLAPGNHDYLAPGSAYLTHDWPENVHIFTEQSAGYCELPEINCRVWGAGFTCAHSGPLLDGFSAPEDGVIDLMVLHGDAMNAESAYNPITKRQIEHSNLNYLALGHIHQASGLLRAGKTAYAWPGCAMGRGFDELGEKGAYLGTLDESDCRLDFLPLSKRRYEILRVAAGDDALAAVMAALPEDTQSDIYRIIFTGESEPVDVRALYTTLKARFFGLTLRDETTPRRNLWAGCEDDTLQGLFLRALKSRYDTAQSEEERQTVALAARYGAAALEERTVEL